MLFLTWQCVQAKDRFNAKPIQETNWKMQLKAIFITFAFIGLPHTYAGRCLIKLSVKLWSRIQINHARLEKTQWVFNYRQLCFDNDFFQKYMIYGLCLMFIKLLPTLIGSSLHSFLFTVFWSGREEWGKLCHSLPIHSFQVTSDPYRNAHLEGE